MQNALVITRGNDRTFAVVAKDAVGAAADLTDAYVWFTAKSTYDQLDEDALILKNSALGGGIVITNPPTGGLVEITVSAADTEAIFDARHRKGSVLYWDLKVKDGEGRRTTLARGTLVIEAEVTRADNP